MQISLLLLSLAATLSLGTPVLEERGKIGHDKVVGFKQAVQGGAVGRAR